ncbi:MAG: hydroxyacylglutathione hydrolase [Gammaproteobacteria bacterium]|nr:hydroxyacylglutathione hydrolase [Gammaproteobacteria bacterium]
MLNIITIPAFDDNYIWLIHQEENNNCVVVDPGDDEPVMEVLNKLQLNLEAILITHHHPDHTGGVKQLVAATGASVYGPANEDIKELDYRLSEKDTVNLDKSALSFSVFDVPGHTKGHIAYLTEDALFSGDSLFAGGCGRIFEGTAEQMYQSLTKLSLLPADTRIYCAHEYTEGNLNFALAVEPENNDLVDRINEVKKKRANGQSTVPSLMHVEHATNPFLRSQQKSVMKVAESRLGKVPSSEIETFSSIRSWKDSF